jgi:hypothetical protein
MPKKKRAKYNEGSLTAHKDFPNIGAFSAAAGGSQDRIDYSVTYQTPKKYRRFGAIGATGSSSEGITNVGASTGTAKTRFNVKVGVGPYNKGDVSATVSRDTKAGRFSATVGRQPKPFSYGKETFIGINATKEY